LLIIIGAVVGVIVYKLAKNYTRGDPTMKQKLFEGFRVIDAVMIVVPAVLMVVFKKYKTLRYFFIGWLVGSIASEVYEWAYGHGGWEEGIPSPT